jgi:hypothetical protein
LPTKVCASELLPAPHMLISLLQFAKEQQTTYLFSWNIISIFVSFVPVSLILFEIIFLFLIYFFKLHYLRTRDNWLLSLIRTVVSVRQIPVQYNLILLLLFRVEICLTSLYSKLFDFWPFIYKIVALRWYKKCMLLYFSELYIF